MEIEAHLLGTSSARPANGREVSGSVVIVGKYQIAIDAGEGFQTRLKKQAKVLKNAKWETRISHTRLDVLALTHGHLDHCWGVLPMLLSMGLDNRTRPLSVIAPIHPDAYQSLITGGIASQMPNSVPAVDLVNQMRFWWTHLFDKISEDKMFPISWFTVSWQDGEEKWLQLFPNAAATTPASSTSDPAIESTTTPLSGVTQLVSAPELIAPHSITPHQTIHSVPSCGWRITSAEKPGKFDGERTSKLSLNDQQIAQLAKGIDIVCQSGDKLLASEFRGPSTSGHSLLITGDTGADAPGLLALCNSPPLDLLIHESTYSDSQQSNAKNYLHSTSRDAAKVATQIGAKNLVLTHYSSRFVETDIPLTEARQEHQRVHAGEDGDIFQIMRDGDLKIFRIFNSEITSFFQPQ